MKELYSYKYKLGKIEELDLLNIEQSLLRAKQNLLSNDQNRNLLIKITRFIGKARRFCLHRVF